MRQVLGDLWGFAEYGFADVVVVTTNGSVNKRALAVMGRGCALEAARRFPDVPRQLAIYLTLYGNRAFVLKRKCPPSSFTLASMPVKNNWFDRARIDLIERSAHELVEMADKFEWRSIVLPRAGCGNGGLAWADVEPRLAAILDDRFTAVTFDKEDKKED